jgi:catechol 2,3-dioxygenase-like lactoylglutathione lyase family enzyme
MSDAGTRIDHQLYGLQPVLPARDVAETVAYYRDTLGFQVDFLWGDPPTHARVMAGDRATGGPVRIQFTGGLARRPERSSAGWLMIHVGADLDELCDEYRARGVTILSEPAARPWGLRVFEIEDCNGHVIRFAGSLPSGS